MQAGDSWRAARSEQSQPSWGPQWGRHERAKVVVTRRARSPTPTGQQQQASLAGGRRSLWAAPPVEEGNAEIWPPPAPSDVALSMLADTQPLALSDKRNVEIRPLLPSPPAWGNVAVRHHGTVPKAAPAESGNLEMWPPPQPGDLRGAESLSPAAPTKISRPDGGQLAMGAAQTERGTAPTFQQKDEVALRPKPPASAGCDIVNHEITICLNGHERVSRDATSKDGLPKTWAGLYRVVEALEEELEKSRGEWQEAAAEESRQAELAALHLDLVSECAAATDEAAVAAGEAAAGEARAEEAAAASKEALEKMEKTMQENANRAHEDRSRNEEEAAQKLAEARASPDRLRLSIPNEVQLFQIYSDPGNQTKPNSVHDEQLKNLKEQLMTAQDHSDLRAELAQAHEELAAQATEIQQLSKGLDEANVWGCVSPTIEQEELTQAQDALSQQSLEVEQLQQHSLATLAMAKACGLFPDSDECEDASQKSIAGKGGLNITTASDEFIKSKLPREEALQLESDLEASQKQNEELREHLNKAEQECHAGSSLDKDLHATGKDLDDKLQELEEHNAAAAAEGQKKHGRLEDICDSQAMSLEAASAEIEDLKSSLASLQEENEALNTSNQMANDAEEELIERTHALTKDLTRSEEALDAEKASSKALLEELHESVNSQADRATRERDSIKRGITQILDSSVTKQEVLAATNEDLRSELQELRDEDAKLRHQLGELQNETNVQNMRDMKQKVKELEKSEAAAAEKLKEYPWGATRPGDDADAKEGVRLRKVTILDGPDSKESERVPLRVPDLSTTHPDERPHYVNAAVQTDEEARRLTTKETHFAPAVSLNIPGSSDAEETTDDVLPNTWNRKMSTPEPTDVGAPGRFSIGIARDQSIERNSPRELPGGRRSTVMSHATSIGSRVELRPRSDSEDVASWDADHIRRIVEEMFASHDAGSGVLSWKTGEVMQFVGELFLNHDAPAPYLPAAVYSTLYNQVKIESHSDYRAGLDIHEMGSFCIKVHDFVYKKMKGEMQHQQRKRTTITPVSSFESEAEDPRKEAPSGPKLLSMSGGWNSSHVHSSGAGAPNSGWWDWWEES